MHTFSQESTETESTGGHFGSNRPVLPESLPQFTCSSFNASYLFGLLVKCIKSATAHTFFYFLFTPLTHFVLLSSIVLFPVLSMMLKPLQFGNKISLVC